MSATAIEGGAGTVATPAAQRGSRTALVAVVVVAVIGTLLIYEPWRGVPFEIVDFSEFLPFFRQPTQTSRFHAFLQYYGALGRWNVVSYALLIGKWTLFGWHTAWWELSRFVEMWAIMGGIWVFLTRLGASAWGAAAGAGLFSVATVAVPAWVRLTMGEPFGMVCFVPALVLAADYRRSNGWLVRAIGLSVLVALALLTKEMLIAFVPFVVIVAACVDGPGRLAWPRCDRRTCVVAGLVAASTVAVLIPIAAVVRHAGQGNFASGFGWRVLNWRSLADNFATVMFPARRAARSLASILITPADTLFVIVLAAGLGALLTRPEQSTKTWHQMLGWAALSLSLPCLVVAAYQPWSFFQDFYGLPFLVGPAMLVAGSVTAIERATPRWASGVLGACAGILLLAAASASRPAHQSMARREVHGALVQDLVARDAGAPVLVMSADIFGVRWQGPAATLRRYALALYPAAHLGPFEDAHCAVPPRPYVVDGTPGIVISYAANCGTYPGVTTRVRSEYRYLALWPLALRRDSVQVDVCDQHCAR